MTQQPESISSETSSQGSSIWLPMIVVGLAAGVSVLFFWMSRNSQPGPRAVRNLAEEAQLDLQRRDYKPLSETLETLLADTSYKAVATQKHPLLGRAAPDFSLKDVQSKSWKLSDALKDGPVVVVFYYGYHCDHCVSQLFGLNKDIGRFRELGAKIVAISADPPELTRERYTSYGEFAFPVLHDDGNKVAEQYGTFRPDPFAQDNGHLDHGTFVIHPKGQVVWINKGDEPFTENRTLLLEIQRCKKAASTP